MGACNNTDDVAALAVLVPSNARQVAADCGLKSCSAESGLQDPFTTCVSDWVEQAVAGLSSDCSNCYGDFTWCSMACLGLCDVNSCDPLCIACLSTSSAGCIQELNQCAGRMSNDCPGDT